MILGFKLRKKCIDFIDIFRRLTNILGYLIWLTVDPMKFNQIKTKKIKNLLICDTGGGIGDILNTLGLINSFKTIYNDVDIFLVLEEKRLNLVKGNPKIKFLTSKIKEVTNKFKIDAAIVISGKGAIIRVGKVKLVTTLQNDSFKSNLTLSNFFVTRRKFPKKYHWTKRRIHCFELLGFKLPNKLEFYSDKKDKLNAKKFYDKINPKKKKIILFSPDSAKSEKARKLNLFPSADWLLESFSKLADKLIEKYSALIVVNGVEKEESSQKILSNCKNKNIKFCGELSVRELGEFMKLCDLLVSVDSGPVHLAAQIGIPVIDLMGPKCPEFHCAWPLSSKVIFLSHPEVCSKCRKYYCAEKNNICMKSITVEEVFNHSKFLLEKN